MKLVPIDIDSMYDPSRVITNAEILNKDGSFTSDGIYSELIYGGSSGEEIEYSCQCGVTHGRIAEGMKCPECGEIVKAKHAIISRLGWIDLGVHKVINPRFLPFMYSYIGTSRLKRYLYDQISIDTDGNIQVCPEEAGSKKKDPLQECIGIGVPDFINNFDAIIEYFHSVKAGDKEDVYQFLMKHRSKLFISKIPVFSPKLRPVVIMGDKVITDQFNDKYVRIIKLNAGLRSLSQDKTLLSEIPYVNEIQKLLEEVDLAVITCLNGKKGLIRNTVLGSRLNFTARCVLTPLGTGSEIDEVHIPYVTALELFKLEILKFLKEKRGISYFEAIVEFNKSVNTFNEEIYDFLIERLGPTGKQTLINRNPTIAIGSILCMRITHIKRDITDLTMSIRNNVLKYLNADFDGDVLSIFLTLIEDLEPPFRKLKPQKFVFNSNDGKFNPFMDFSKDYLLGLQTLLT